MACSSLAVLEGIAVSIDPNYKVLGSTYPWIAKKVLTDSSPKLKASLQALLYEVHSSLFFRLSNIFAFISLGQCLCQYDHFIGAVPIFLSTQSTQSSDTFFSIGWIVPDRSFRVSTYRGKISFLLPPLFFSYALFNFRISGICSQSS